MLHDTTGCEFCPCNSSDMSEARSYRDYASYYGDRGMARDYRQTGAVGDMLGSFSDWDRSGYGGGCCCGGGGYGGQGVSSYFSDGTLIALLAAGALAFYILWTQVTAAQAGGTGRRRRGIRNNKQEDDSQFEVFGQTLMKGR